MHDEHGNLTAHEIASEPSVAVGVVDDDAFVATLKKPRFYCAGARRLDEDVGKKWCDYKAPKRWHGLCPKCKRPFACLEIKRGKTETQRETLDEKTMAAVKPMVYHATGIPELDKVLGGGVVYEKLLMLGAPPGVGKTTLLLQVCDGFAQGHGRKAYFASGEMSGGSNKDYAKRLGITNPNIALFCDPQGVDVEDLFDDVLDFGAQLLIIDSVQVARVCDVKADIGQPAQIDAVINMVSSFVQDKNRTAIIISQLNKSGDYAGSAKAQFLVDGLIRMDYHCTEFTPEGKPAPGNPSSGVRRLYMDGKSRQGRSDVSSLVELTDVGVRPVSIPAMRELAKMRAAK